MVGVKVVTIGDGAVGKTCMLVSYSTDSFPETYVPTVYDKYDTNLMVDDKSVHLSLWDTAGQEGFDRLRPVSYQDTDVFIVCYAINSPESLENVRAKWVPEIHYHCPGIPYILVGTKSDLRQSTEVKLTDTTARKIVNKKQRETTDCTIIDPAAASKEAKENGASEYTECSAKTQRGLKNVFVTAVKVALASRAASRRSRNLCLLL